MPRPTWKGAITFGLVHVPVALYPASREDEIDFDWLDKRTLDPVGYKRVNKRTGKEVAKDDIVKGVKQDDGEYVVLSEDELRAAYPKTTQTIEIESFVEARDVAFVYLEKPYYLEPAKGGEKVYALLREAMARSGVIGIARMVMHTKEHLAALIPTGPALMLETIRWSDEIRPADELALPEKEPVKDSELKMAEQLIDGMTVKWQPEHYADRFNDAIQALLARKVEAGETEKVQPLEEAPDLGANVVDLAELLKKSLGRQSASGERRPARRASRAGDRNTKPHAARRA
ncbi:MAG: Ku protein [Betaproteobacteria bacterium]